MTYRAPDEVARLRAEKDCLKLFRRKVSEAGLLEGAALDAIEGEVATLIEGAVRRAKADAMPEPADLLTDVYVSY